MVKFILRQDDVKRDRELGCWGKYVAILLLVQNGCAHDITRVCLAYRPSRLNVFDFKLT